MTVNAGQGSLTIAAGRGAGREAVLSWKGADGKEETLTFTITDDTRISWSENGTPLITQGAAALQKGALTAVGADDTLIRVNAAMVQGGEAASTVVNLSEKAATFAGGRGGMTFLGSYVNSTISGGQGKNIFAGAFTQSKVSGGDADDEFSGAFAGGMLSGGKGKDVFSGFFLDQAEIDGGEGDDAFVGAFNSVKLYGGTGKNFFGFRSGVNPRRNHEEEALLGAARKKAAAGEELSQDDQERLKAGEHIDKSFATEQFINVDIEAGEEDAALEGFFRDSRISLGKGENEVRGFMLDTRLDASQAKTNTMRFGLLDGTTVLSGTGNDDIRATTALHARIDAGEGDDRVVVGNLGDQPSTTMRMGGLQWDLNFTEFDYSPDNPDDPNLASGTLEYNVVNAGKGKNTVSVATGDETAELLAGDKVEELKEEKKAESAAGTVKTEEGSQNGPASDAKVADDVQAAAVSGLRAPVEGLLAEFLDTDEKAEEEQTKQGDLRWDFSADGAGGADAQGSAAVQVIMNESERRTFRQSYGAREAKQRTFTNFASSNPGLWMA